MPFVKLDTGILDSSLWSEPAQTCKCWITLLAMADAEGFVRSTAPGIARRANLGLADTETALQIFESPDSHSRTLDDQGKRIKRIDGGYQIVNYEKYRERDYTAAERQKRWREKKKSNAVTPVTRNVISRRVTHAEAEAEADKGEASVKRMPTGRNGVVDSEWIASLKSDKTYEGIDVDKELGKLHQWCKIRQLTASRRRFINWLNRAEKPITGNGSMSPQHRQNRINFLNEKKQKTNRQIKDPDNPPSWAVAELARIDAELKKL